MAVLVGVSDVSAYTVESPLLNNDLTYYEDYVASASGPVSSIGVYLRSATTATQVKLILCDSAGNHLAIVTVPVSGLPAWVDGTINGVTITQGTTYRLVAILDGYFYANTDSSSWEIYYGNGPFATPPNPVVNTGNANGGNLAFRVQGTTGPVKPANYDILLPFGAVDTRSIGFEQGWTNGSYADFPASLPSGVSFKSPYTGWADAPLTNDVADYLASDTAGDYPILIGVWDAETGSEDSYTVTLRFTESGGGGSEEGATSGDAILVKTGGPTVNDGLLSYYRANGGGAASTLPDAEMAFLKAVYPAGSGTVADRWRGYLTSLGYTGTLSDMMLRYWSAP